jgi:GGDEF domain-containing protein
MSPEEMQKELLTSPVTGLPNKRAFDEAQHQPAKAVAMSDADGLKALNDKFGYDAGNELLKAKAEALKEAGLDAYHEKGDEFLFRGASKEELHSKLEKAREILRNRVIEVQMKDGSVRRFKGADF